MGNLQKVLKKIDEMWEEEVSFIAKLGKYPSTLGNEASIQRFCAEFFKERGWETDVFVPDVKSLSKHPGFSTPEWSYDGRPVVVAKHATSGPKIGKSLILQGHLDVVSAEPLSLWDYDPWGSTIEGNRMYGRGICDMKSGVAAMIYALKAIQESEIELGADVFVQTVIEEECTGNGALAALERGYVADGGLIPEPFGLTALTTQVGVIWMRVRVIGAGAHVHSATQAVNAIHKAYYLIQALERYRERINHEPKHPAYSNINHPLQVNVGTIHAGDWPSTVPSECTFEVRVGFYPGEDPEVVKHRVRDWLMEAASNDPWLKEMPPEITFYGFHAHGLSIDPELPIFQTLAKAHRSIVGDEMQTAVSTATTDIRFFNLFYDIPTTCYGPYGENTHAPNEWVDLDSVLQCTRVYAAFILEWCGVRE